MIIEGDLNDETGQALTKWFDRGLAPPGIHSIAEDPSLNDSRYRISEGTLFLSLPYLVGFILHLRKVSVRN